MFDELVDHAERSGWRTVFTRAKAAGVQFHKDHPKGAYRHSFIVNSTSLNFYLRPPALRIDSTATDRANRAFDEVKANANGASETTIKLRTLDDARRAAEMFLS